VRDTVAVVPSIRHCVAETADAATHGARHRTLREDPSMFQRILLPVDLSDRGDRALEAIRALGPAEQTSVTLLHVIETLDLPFDEMEEFYDRLHERAVEALDRLAGRLAERGVEVGARIVYGSRVPEILAHAGEIEADLIVMSSRRRSPEDPESGWPGISHQVAFLSQVPVLLVK
jgi:nucleotide-binding universal stress UspA family protein